MPKISVTLTEEVDSRIADAILHRGFKDKADFIRHAIMNELAIPDIRYEIAKISEGQDAQMQAFYQRIPSPSEKDAEFMRERAREDHKKWRTYVAGKLNGNVSRRELDKSWRQAVSNSSAEASDDLRQADKLGGAVDAEDGAPPS